MRRALVYVQHLLGVGHVARISRVAAALGRSGVKVTVASGGAPVAGFDFGGSDVIQLDPVHVRADAMGVLLAADGAVFDAERQAARRSALVALLDRLRPDILLTEAFPFGRRQMRFELLPLLEHARAIGTPLIACSIRDILQERAKPGRAEETAELVERFYDLVLVHGDPAFAPLGATFPLAKRIAEKIAYTGIVAPEPPDMISREHRVVVSAGGGSVGAALLDAAVAALPMTRFAGQPALVLTGANLPDNAFDRLRAGAPRWIRVERFQPDLAAHLAGADLSISQAGYNTVADVLVAGCAAVFVPYAAGGETEQPMRARLLAEHGLCETVGEAGLSTDALAAAIERAAAGRRGRPSIDLNGAHRTAMILPGHLSARKA